MNLSNLVKQEPHRFVKSNAGSYILQGTTIILYPIFQSSNQGGSTIPWLYYPTTYKHVLVSARVLFSVYRFDGTTEWFTQLVTCYYKCPMIYARYVGAQIHTQCCLQISKCGPWVYAHELTILLSDKSLEA